MCKGQKSFVESQHNMETVLPEWSAYDWIGKLKKGRKSVTYEEKSGCPSASTADSIERTSDMVLPEKSSMTALAFVQSVHDVSQNRLQKKINNVIWNSVSAFWIAVTSLQMHHYWEQNVDPPVRAKEQIPESGMETWRITCEGEVQDATNSRKSNAYSFFGLAWADAGTWCGEG